MWSLHPTARQALWLRAEAGLTTREIAERLELCSSQAAHLIAAARQELRTILIESEGGLADKPYGRALGMAA